MTIYELNEQAAQLYALLESGEIDEDIFNDTLEAMGAEEKIKNCCYIIKQLEADAKVLKEEKDKLEAKQKTAENGAKRMRAKVLEFMNITNTKKSKVDIFTLNVVETKSVNITDESKIPAVFLVEQAPKIDKTAIKKALSEGEAVAGAEIQINESVRLK